MRLRRNTSAFLCLVFLAMAALGGCTAKQETGTAGANAREPKGTFVIGLLPERNIFLQKRRYRPLAAYLSKRLGTNIKTKLLDSYDAIYKQMYDRSVDAAFFGSLSYVAMHSRLPLDPIARPVRENGKSTYRGVIFALKGKGITEDVATWKGRKIALVERSTASGYLFPEWYLATHGIRDINTFFGKVVYAGSYDAAIAEVLTGHSDIGCATDYAFSDFLNKNKDIRGKLVIFARSVPFPSDILGVREDMDPQLKLKLRNALLDMEGTKEGKEVLEAFGAKRFIATRESDFTPVLGMLKTIGLRPGDIALEAIGRGGGGASTEEPEDGAQ